MAVDQPGRRPRRPVLRRRRPDHGRSVGAARMIFSASVTGRTPRPGAGRGATVGSAARPRRRAGSVGRRDVALRAAEAHGLADARGVSQQLPERTRAGRVVALVAEVGAHGDVAHAHEPGHRRERVGSSVPSCIWRSNGVEQVGRRRRAVGDQLAGHVGPVHEPGRDRVDRVAPAVGREVDARHLEHAGAVAAARRGRPRPRSSRRGCPRLRSRFLSTIWPVHSGGRPRTARTMHAGGERAGRARGARR